MYTSIAVLALSAWVGAATQGKDPVWQHDYGKAYKQGRAEKKPLAIFIGSGGGGYHKVAENGTLSKKTKEVLKKNYVCVYVDTATASGREYAEAFRLDTGVVLSDRKGDTQAFRHGGTLSSEHLTGYLERFADPNLVVDQTITHHEQRTSYYPPSDPIVYQNFGRSSGGC